MSTNHASIEQRVGEILYARDQENGHLHRCSACGEMRGFKSTNTEICEACDASLQYAVEAGSERNS
jgi:uncharacterized protein (DUF983 family)